MNKRARNRLIGITVVIILAIVVAVVWFGQDQAAYNMTVANAADAEAGSRIKVSGIVITGSWDKKTNPMTFKIKDETDTSDGGPQLTVVYTGQVPSTFGDGVTAIVTGEIDANMTVTSGEMITKCPSKYESATGAYNVAQLVEKSKTMIQVPLKVAGSVKTGSINPLSDNARLVIVDTTDPTVELVLNFAGTLPEGIVDGSKVVITGELNEAGSFDATDVAIEK